MVQVRPCAAVAVKSWEFGLKVFLP
jgi:hypothetical protein